MLSDPSTLKLIVRAELRKGYEPVIGADVEIQVGSLPWKPMTDDGTGKPVLHDDAFSLCRKTGQHTMGSEFSIVY